MSYHGFKAKNKSFEVEIKTDLDETIGKVAIVPQDFGRVLVNLFNNAFYSAYMKKQSRSASSRKNGNKVEIHIRDNGLGIAENILPKIFQPFYTTKPTGQGTGLGLSLSYDIIKAHGGDLKVDTRVGEFAAFTIVL